MSKNNNNNPELTDYIIKYKSNQNDKNSNENINPFLAVFPFNYPNISMLNNETETTWDIGQNKDKKLKSDKSILGINSKVIFEARTKTNENNKSDYVLGIIKLNKKKERIINFYDVDSIFCFSQKIRKIEENKNLINDLNNDDEGGNKLDLMTHFGTSKAQKMAFNMRNNLIDENNIASANLAKKLLKKNAENSELLQNNEEEKMHKLLNFKEILPTFDLNATNVDSIFDFESIISYDDLGNISINELQKNIINRKLDKKNFSEYVYNYIYNLSEKIINGKKLDNKLKYSIYLDELIKFYNLPKIIKDSPEKINIYTKIPLNHVKNMLKLYSKMSTDSNNNITYYKNQNLILRNIYHILILALLLNKYEFDFSLLSKSLKLDNKKISTYYKEIGCTIKSSIKNNKNENSKGKNFTIVKLTAPLKLNLGTKRKFKKK